MPAPSNDSQWVPTPLRTWFWVSYVCVLVAGAIALEVALHFSNKDDGTCFLVYIPFCDSKFSGQGGQLRKTRRRVFCITYTYVWGLGFVVSFRFFTSYADPSCRYRYDDFGRTLGVDGHRSEASSGM